MQGGSFVTTDGGTSVVVVVDAWEWVVTEWRWPDDEGRGEWGLSSLSMMVTVVALFARVTFRTKAVSILKLSLRNPPNLSHGCGFRMGISNVTCTHTRLTHTHILTQVCKPVMCTIWSAMGAMGAMLLGVVCYV